MCANVLNSRIITSSLLSFHTTHTTNALGRIAVVVVALEQSNCVLFYPSILLQQCILSMDLREPVASLIFNFIE